MEDKQKILDALCEALRCTENAGAPDCNPLKQLLFIKGGSLDVYNAALSPFVKEGRVTDDVVRPIFEDGTGTSGYYDVCVGADSGTAMIVDVATQFIRKMW